MGCCPIYVPGKHHQSSDPLSWKSQIFGVFFFQIFFFFLTCNPNSWLSSLQSPDVSQQAKLGLNSRKINSTKPLTSVGSSWMSQGQWLNCGFISPLALWQKTGVMTDKQLQSTPLQQKTFPLWHTAPAVSLNAWLKYSSIIPTTLFLAVWRFLSPCCYSKCSEKEIPTFSSWEKLWH